MEAVNAGSLETAVVRLKELANSGGTWLVEGAEIELGRQPYARMTLAGMARLMERSGNRFQNKVLHLRETPFDLDREVGRALDARKVGADRRDEARICREALERIGTAVGATGPSMVTCHIEGGGLMNVATGLAPWYEGFLQEAGPAIDAALAGIADSTEAESRRTLRAQARTLLADPRFNAPKVTRSKREFLAREIFPGLRAKACEHAVEEAENLAWFESSPGAAGTVPEDAEKTRA